MTTIYLVLKISALLVVLVLPLVGPRKKKNIKGTSIEMSDWAINENGSLENLTETNPGEHYPLKIK
jgi:hypothetical protein